MRHQIQGDGVTVWVNGPDGSCLGRFGTLGIDIHRSMEDQMSGRNECLLCTHGPTTIAHWREFVVGIKTHHGVSVDDRHMPKRFKSAARS